MQDNTEISKYLATEVMGRCWHEWEAYGASDGSHAGYTCFKCGEDYPRYMPRDWIFTESDYPNYLTNLSDRQDLLEACVGMEWWGYFKREQWKLFYQANFPKDRDAPILVSYQSGIPTSLLIPKDSLASAIYRYLKGEEG